MNDKQLALVEGGRELEQYDPDQALKEISVSEAAEKHWRRAKDATKLREAIKAKLLAQAEYVVWRDRVVVPSQEMGSSGVKGRSRISERKSDLPAADPGPVVIHRWRKRLCSDPNEGDKVERATEKDFEKIERAKEEAAKKAQQIIEFHQAANYSSESNEWYTPSKYIQAVREVLGDIDLDPASNEQANSTVRAKDFFDVNRNGLETNWFGRVFLNPPYGVAKIESDGVEKRVSLAGAFCMRAINQYVEGHIEAGIVLVNSLHSQSWQAPLYDYPICFVDHRIHFVSADGEENENPTFQNIFVYLGLDVPKFARVFSRFGYVVQRISG